MQLDLDQQRESEKISAFWKAFYDTLLGVQFRLEAFVPDVPKRGPLESLNLDSRQFMSDFAEGLNAAEERVNQSAP